MRHAIVFGASGQIGQPLLDRLRAADWEVTAVSRQGQPDARGLQWLEGSLQQVDGLPAQADVVFSCGPLDHFARWWTTTRLSCARVIAFGSTSVDVKVDSPDAAERDLAARLRGGERGVLATSAARGVAATVLRPTLVYGRAGDRSLTRIAALASRWGRFVLPTDAIGLRQPVHVDDLAAAAMAAVDRPASHGAAFAVPGGEIIRYRDMVARTLAALSPTPVLHTVPPGLFRGLLVGAHCVGIAREFNSAALRRMRQDLVFDLEPARRAFGYAPRVFSPTVGMFEMD